MSVASSPPELLSEIYKYIEDSDYKTLYSCIRVNKKWHDTIIPKLWKNSFYSTSSTKILINCLLAEEEDFLKKKKIKLNFKLLEKQPLLHNYASYITVLDFNEMNSGIRGLLLDNCEIHCCQKRLLEFILDHSSNIKALRDYDPDYTSLFVNHYRFDDLFQTLYELDSVNFNPDCCVFLEKLSNTCRTIQVLKIRYDSLDSDNAVRALAILINAQRQIKELVIKVYGDLILSADFMKAISIHSKSIISFESNNRNISYSLIPIFSNLETLLLDDYSKGGLHNYNRLYLQHFVLCNLQVLCLNLHQLSFFDLSDFIDNINGKNIKHLTIRGSPIDTNYLGILIKSIGQNCKNLEHLEIFYNNQVNNQLIFALKKCTKLKHITLSKMCTDIVTKKVLNVFNQALPKHLNTISFNHEFTSETIRWEPRTGNNL